jgi:hypothetical protein
MTSTRPLFPAVCGMPRITEAEFIDQVLQLAKLHGWRRAHFRPARTRKGYRTPVQGDGKGFPDLVLIHEERGLFIAAECKVGNNRASPEQKAWLRAFRSVGAQTFVWWPKDWAVIVKLLGVA